MTKILRGIGLIFIGVGAWLAFHAYHNLFKGGKAKMFLKTLGDGTGSNYRVCGKDDPNFEQFASVDFKDKDSSTLKYHFYNIENPEEYLKGNSDAIAVENGPYLLKKHSIKYNIDFKASSMTDAEEPKPNGAIEYDVANAYIGLETNTDLTSSLSRSSSDLTVSSTSTKKTVGTYEKTMPDHLSMSDTIANLSPVYLSTLGLANDEFSLMLSLVCTPSQIANIPLAESKAQCSALELNDMDKPDCSCCMLNDAYKANGSPMNSTNCNTLLDDEGTVMSTLSLLAYYDGGIPVKNKGETKYDDSSTLFNATLFKQEKIYSPLIQKHTVNDLLFGYPSAFVGKVIPNLFMSRAHEIMKQAGITGITQEMVATEILSGSMDDDIGFKLGNVAAYTKDVGAVCLSTCSEVSSSSPFYDSPLGWMCDGKAPSRHTTSNIDEILLGDIDCRPYSATFATKKMCEKIDFVLISDPSATGYQSCACADGSDDWQTSGCCLASGEYNGIDITANGCLYPVAGVVDPNYVGMDMTSTNGKPTFDVGKAVESWASREASNKHTRFMCPDNGVLINEHKVFGQFEEYEGKSNHVTFHHTGNDRIRQDDSSKLNATTFTATVAGASTSVFPGTGLTAWFSVHGLSNGHTFKGQIPIHVKELKSGLMFEEDWVLRPIVCDDNLCHLLARLKVARDAFKGTELSKSEGKGLPYDGLQAIGHNDGPAINGRPTYIHQPLYLNGDDTLLTQQNSSHVDGPSGNGIKIFHQKDYDSNPGTFSQSNTKYDLVDKAWVEANEESLQSYLDLEPATGLGIRSKLRFAKSYSIWECDPETNDHCKLARHSSGSGKCYGSVGGDIFSSLSHSQKQKLVAVNATTFTYPCSAANILSPHVIGGKIIPTYWYEEARHEVEDSDVSKLTALADEYFSIFNNFNWRFFIGWLLSVHLGLQMLLKWFLFSPPKEWLKHGAIKAAGANAATLTAGTSSVGSAASTTSVTEK